MSDEPKGNWCEWRAEGKGRGGQQRSEAGGVAECDSHILKAMGRFSCTLC